MGTTACDSSRTGHYRLQSSDGCFILAMLRQTHMTATGQSFADFVAERDNVADMEKQIENYCLMLCEALIQDFTSHHPNSDPYKFYIESGRKYHKLIMETEAGSRSVHAFIDKRFGHVYKPASFKSPAKHIRYNLLVDNSREECFARCDWAGGYLYM